MGNTHPIYDEYADRINLGDSFREFYWDASGYYEQLLRELEALVM